MKLFFLFCPFCNSNKWNRLNGPTSIPEKTKVYQRCDSCRKFTYCNVVTKSKLILPASFDLEEAYVIEAEVDNFYISVDYYKNKTFLRKKPEPIIDIMATGINAFEMILDRVVEFNWRDQEHIIIKIRTFIMLT